jgi:hypothetical protein
MNMLVTAITAAAGSTALSPALADTTDDTVARIAEHRSLTMAIDDVCHRMGDLEEQLPDDRCKNYFIHDRGTDVGNNDDPRWTNINQEYWESVDRHDAIAWSFIDRPPTTVAGVIALLRYAKEFTDAGYEWPDSRHHFDNGLYAGRTDEQWETSLISAAAVGLSQLT